MTGLAPGRRFKPPLDVVKIVVREAYSLHVVYISNADDLCGSGVEHDVFDVILLRHEDGFDRLAAIYVVDIKPATPAGRHERVDEVVRASQGERDDFRLFSGLFGNGARQLPVVAVAGAPIEAALFFLCLIVNSDDRLAILIGYPVGRECGVRSIPSFKQFLFPVVQVDEV